jgi:citrate lyase beta subunit
MAAVQQVLFAVRLAAGKAGVEAYDGAFADVRDTDGFRAEAQLARRLGFAGKSCIHPSQVALANEALPASDEEIAHALRVTPGRAGRRRERRGCLPRRRPHDRPPFPAARAQHRRDRTPPRPAARGLTPGRSP